MSASPPTAALQRTSPDVAVGPRRDSCSAAKTLLEHCARPRERRPSQLSVIIDPASHG
jgi:hypothetical protein